MSVDTANLAALIGSRICHDLISPIGAITNGLELLELSGTAKGPELSLVTDSAANANARIRLFRLTFGAAAPDQAVSSEEVSSILSDVYADGRVSVTWNPTHTIPRPVAKAALLALLCAEQAIPFGGSLSVTCDSDQWTITAAGERLSPDPELWATLRGDPAPRSLAPAAVQFVMLPGLLASMNLKCHAELTENTATITF